MIQELLHQKTYPEYIRTLKTQQETNNPMEKKLGKIIEQALHQRDYLDDK